MIFHLLYISQTSQAFAGVADVEDIIKKSITKNSSREITGMLVTNGNFFIQVLEGKEKSVLKTYDEIVHDKRHSNVKTLMTFHSSTRMFPGWYMGLIDPKHHELAIRDLIPLLHVDILKKEDSKEKAISILKQFNQIDKRPMPSE